MTEVGVVFPSGGSVDCQESELVQPNQEFSWRIQSWNQSVSKVKVAFDSGINFFQTLENGQTVPTHESPERSLTYDANGFASTTIYGTAPPTQQSVTHKYTVTGVGAGIELDPEISVIVGPGGGGGPRDSAGGGG